MRRIVLSLAFTALTLILPTRSFALTYSLVDDWSNISNPNGPWSYNAGSNPLPFNVADWPLDEFGPSQTAWAYGNVLRDTFLPGWFKSVVDPNSFGHAQPYDWLVGDVIVHSSDSTGSQKYGPANVTWTSPTDGIYDIYGGLWSGRDIGRSNDWKLYLDNVLLANGSVFDGDIYSRSNPDSFNFNGVSISQGSVLRLEVVRTTNGEDFVGVNFDINVVPEPATGVLLLSGLLGLARLRKIVRSKE